MFDCVGAMAVALGRGAAGTYSTSDKLWTLLHQVNIINTT